MRKLLTALALLLTFAIHAQGQRSIWGAPPFPIDSSAKGYVPVSKRDGNIINVYRIRLDSILAAGGGGSGTVTSVSGSIPVRVATGTTTPAITVDTGFGGVSRLSTIWDRTKGLDSLGVALALKVNISDTSANNNAEIRTISLTTPSVVYSTPINFSVSSHNASGALILNTQSANTHFAGPVSGGAAAPTFRALVSADIPDLSGTYLTSATATSTYLPKTGGTMTGNLLFTDNTYDLGAVSSGRVRNYYGAGTIAAGGSITGTQIVGTGNFPFAHTSRGFIAFPSDGVITVYNNALTDFDRVNMGGTTSSFPTIKRSGIGLEIRGANDVIGSNFLTVPIFRGSDAANGSVTIEGTSSATRTTSAVNLQPNGGNVVINGASTSATLNVKGAGNTSATTSFLVERADGTDLFALRNDGVVLFDIEPTFTFTAGSGTWTWDASVQRKIRINGNRSANSTDGDAALLMDGSFSPTSGSISQNFFKLAPTINQTGGANGITRGLYVAPTLTAAADWRAIETTTGNVIFGNASITSGAPSGGTATAWKLGSKADATVTLDTTKYIQVEIGGVAYKLAIVN